MAHEQYVDLTIARTRYLEAGAGRPLILLHGMGITSSADSFMFVHDALAVHFHVFALDLLGYGKGSRSITEAPMVASTVDHVREFMDVVGLEQASFVGHSAGGWTAAMLAYESPDRVDDLVLLCAAGLNAQIAEGITDQQAPTDQSARAFVNKAVVRPTLDATQIDRLVASLVEVGTQPGALTSLDPIIRQKALPEIRQRYLLHRRMPLITARTLMIWGEGDVMDPYPTWTQEHAELGGDMSRSSKPWGPPRSTYRMIPTGHHPQWEAPDLVVELLVDFLAT